MMRKTDDTFLREEVRTLLHMVIDLTLAADLAEIPTGALALDLERALQRELQSKYPPEPALVRATRLRIQVANLLAHIVEGNPLPVLRDVNTAAMLLNELSARLR